jgi:protein-tyrosine phosphatase/membrane-associated phospholipid phosphatase
MSSSGTNALAFAEPRPWRAAIVWLCFLGPFFFASYGFANWIASQRAEVGSIVFDWENGIPFLAWTIVPYWSIDLFYGVSLVVCTRRGELFTHAMRLFAAQVISVACFLAFPLAFSFARPQVDGLFGWMFDVLAGFDKPFNQAPSLHIALLAILWVLYARHLSGPARWILHCWFALIGVSVLTTFQHHFIDLPTGLWVGCFCLWLVDDEDLSMLWAGAVARDPQRMRLATRYALGAAVFGGTALWVGGWALWLLWIAGSLATVAAIYAFIGEAGFQKEVGREIRRSARLHPVALSGYIEGQKPGTLSPGAFWLLAPYLAGAWLNSRWWTRNCSEANAVVPGLLIGRLPVRRERETAGVRAIVDLAAELPCHASGVSYVGVPMLDLVIPSQKQLERAALAIDSAMESGPVLVCCALGFSRSAMAVAAWLLASKRASDVPAAIELIRHARPAIVLGEAHLRALAQFAAQVQRPAA